MTSTCTCVSTYRIYKLIKGKEKYIVTLIGTNCVNMDFMCWSSDSTWDSFWTQGLWMMSKVKLKVRVTSNAGCLLRRVSEHWYLQGTYRNKAMQGVTVLMSPSKSRLEFNHLLNSGQWKVYEVVRPWWTHLSVVGVRLFRLSCPDLR